MHTPKSPVASTLTLIVLSMIGMADAGYITYEEFAGIVPNCSAVPGFDCGAVLNSPWSMIGPIPLSLLGFGFYLTMFLIGVYLMLARKPHPLVPRLMVGFGGFAFLFSMYLMYVQGVVIGAFCLYCTISAGTSTLIFFTTLWYWYTQKKRELHTHDSSTE